MNKRNIIFLVCSYTFLSCLVLGIMLLFSQQWDKPWNANAVSAIALNTVRPAAEPDEDEKDNSSLPSENEIQGSLIRSTLTQSIVFQPYDIDLSIDLQRHTVEICRENGVDPDLVLAIMWHESRFIPDVRDNVNTNGTHDRGLMQINQCNWGWLMEKGLDVNNPYDNVSSGVLMLSMMLEKYTVEQALMAYQCGESRMRELWQQGYVTKFVYDILAIEFPKIEQPEVAATIISIPL